MNLILRSRIKGQCEQLSRIVPYIWVSVQQKSRWMYICDGYRFDASCTFPPLPSPVLARSGVTFLYDSYNFSSPCDSHYMRPRRKTRSPKNEESNVAVKTGQPKIYGLFFKPWICLILIMRINERKPKKNEASRFVRRRKKPVLAKKVKQRLAQRKKKKLKSDILGLH